MGETDEKKATPPATTFTVIKINLQWHKNVIKQELVFPVALLLFWTILKDYWIYTCLWAPIKTVHSKVHIMHQEHMTSECIMFCFCSRRGIRHV